MLVGPPGRCSIQVSSVRFAEPCRTRLDGMMALNMLRHEAIWNARLMTDYDDDGETQAGARLKHLLEILELENVLVVVSRWYGGTHLGPDRFKLINQAARDALELGGFLEEREKETAAKGKGKKK